MALAARRARAAEGHTLIEQAVVADLRRRADDDPHTVVDDQTPSDLRRRMDLHAGAPPRDLRHPAPQKFHMMRKQPMRNAMVHDGMQAVVQPEYFKFAPRRGVIPLICFYGFF